MIRAYISKTVILTLTLILMNPAFFVSAQDIPKKAAQNRISGGKKPIKMLAAGPDIILHNANVLTMDDQMPNAQAIAIKSNKISAVGSNSSVLALQDINTQLFDLQGRTVVPGMIEVHTHFLQRAFQDDGPDGLVQGTKDMAADGYTTVHELYGNPGFISTAQTLAQNKELSVRINCYIPYLTNCGEYVIPWKTFPYTEKVDTTLRVIGAKIFADGGTCGFPAVTLPYQAGAAAGSYGNLFRTQEEMNAIVDTVLKAGYPIAMHVLGDSAVVVGLNAFEYAFAGNGNTLRSRMEHLRFMREDLADQMAALGIAASIQYTWAKAYIAPNFERIYLPEALEWIFPWRRLADRDIPILGGNDSPYSTRSQAMQTISILATRKMEFNETLSTWLDGDQLTVEEGLRAMTVTNAWIAFEEDLKGSISVGKLADLTILSENPLTKDPFEVRYIDIDMTIMDGIIRHNQIGITHIAVHDAGLFKIGIDDQGLWGPFRARVGLQYNGFEYLYHGSLIISYDSVTVATSNFRQQDYITSSGGEIDFQEPGTTASEQATAVYEDGAAWHPDKLRITQKTFMWEDDPFLLVKYSFENISGHPLSDIYLGHVMDFDIGQYTDNAGGWELNEGLSFAYMYNAISPAQPYIGLVMFDSTGNHVNSAVSFTSNPYFYNNQEQSMAEVMRSGIIQSETSEVRDYSMLLSYGPISFDNYQSKSPFMIAIVIGNTLEELKNGVNQAYARFNGMTQITDKQNETADQFILAQNYPNPFNNATTITYQLPKAATVNISIYNTSGQLVATLVSESQTAGFHEIRWNADLFGSGLYAYRIKAGEFVETKKCLLLK